MTEIAPFIPFAVSDVPSMGSTATSQCGPSWFPTCSPLWSMGALSFSPSPITTTPAMSTVLIMARIAFTAASSARFFSPRPTHGAAAIAAVSVTRISSRAKLRSGIGGIIRDSLSHRGYITVRQSWDSHDQHGMPDR
ncbi:unannotated protein [freshwater metagenome]|uniref:Unannotated protein n=1 Tax=freshwater metagenome TaxID=449393 RepID=A0A6J6ZUC4_9ZZZZ